MGSPELAAMAELLGGLGRMTPDVPVDQQRAAADGVGSMFPVPDGVVVSPLEAPGLRGEWVLAPGADDGRVVLYLHGGGFVIGSPTSHRVWAARLGIEARARVLVLDYRLAPEHPYPAALDDAVAAYRWLLDAGYGPGAVAVAGDSAGGGLALAAALEARRQEMALPAALVCVSPWVDLECRAPSIEARDARDYVLSGAWLRAMADHYLGGADPAAPAASPLGASLGGLPAVLVVVGTEEVLFDDALGIRNELAAAGVAVELEVYEDCAHWWMVAGPHLPETEACASRIAAFLEGRLA
ncbi:MAG TPA: alpha/beta hydrolase [Acidimicrobiales bacterium]|nr:alpha/beta hydrolase [Acidimicrobiales bacterium]